jgi:hypothetical protein
MWVGKIFVWESGSVVSWGTVLQAGMPWVRWSNPSSRTMALGSTQPLTEISTRYLLRVKGGRFLRHTTSLSSVQKFWESRRLKMSWASTISTGLALTFEVYLYRMGCFRSNCYEESFLLPYNVLFIFFFVVKINFGSTRPQGVINLEDRSLQWYLYFCLRIFSSKILELIYIYKNVTASSFMTSNLRK